MLGSTCLCVMVTKTTSETDIERGRCILLQATNLMALSVLLRILFPLTLFLTPIIYFLFSESIISRHCSLHNNYFIYVSACSTVGGLHSLHSTSPSLPQWLTDVEKDDMQMLIGKKCPSLLKHYSLFSYCRTSQSHTLTTYGES